MSDAIVEEGGLGDGGDGPDAADDGFIVPVSMEEDPAQLFPGDSGTLDVEARRVLVQILRRRFLLANQHPAQWRILLENQQVIESRLHDVFVRLVVDHDRGIAYKRQVRSAEIEIPVLLRDESYTRAETLILVHLRTVFQREQGAGETSARVDAEEIEHTVLSYFDPDETNLAKHQKEIIGAVLRLKREGFLEEESERRYRVTPLVEVVLSIERLSELKQWLHNRGRDAADARLGGESEQDTVAPDEPDEQALGHKEDTE